MSLKNNTKLLTTTLATVYTCPAGLEASAHGIVFSNTSTSDVSVTLTYYQASTATTYTLLDGYTIKAEQTGSWPKPVNMGAGDYIQSKAATASVVNIVISTYQNDSVVAVGFTPKGAWASNIAYQQNDVVSYSNESYVASQSSTAQTPSTATAYWVKLASTGATGTAATVAVGTTTTGAAGTSASVTNSGTSAAATFNFTIPRGDTGATGTAATVAVGTTTTGAAGTSASVTNSGTSAAATFNFTIPRGDTGATGSFGPKALTIYSPTSAENITLFYTTQALTISSTIAVVTGVTPTVTYSVYSGASRATVTTTHINAASVSNTTTGASPTIAVASIPANTWVWLQTSAISGTVGSFNLVIALQ